MSRQSETARQIHLDALTNERAGIEKRIELAGEGDPGLTARLQSRLTAIDDELARVGSRAAEEAVRGRRREVRA